MRLREKLATCPKVFMGIAAVGALGYLAYRMIPKVKEETDKAVDAAKSWIEK